MTREESDALVRELTKPKTLYARDRNPFAGEMALLSHATCADAIARIRELESELDGMCRLSHAARKEAHAQWERAQKAEAERDAAVALLRCATTKNPCGTDTWHVGHSCPCAACQLWLAAWTKG